MRKRVLKKMYAIIVAFIIFFTYLTSAYAYNTGDDYPSKYKNAGISSIVDEWNFYNRQCTSFVAWCLNSRNGVAFTNQYGGVSRWGNANEWHTAAKSLGISVNTTPAVGAVAYWSSNHVAWVKAVSGSNVTIEEYNYGYSGKYNSRTISASNPTGYIHIKDINNSTPATPPRNTWIKRDKSYLFSGGDITLEWLANDANAYQLCVYRNIHDVVWNKNMNKETTVNITNLQAGDYIARVIAVNDAGNSQAECTFKVYDTPVINASTKYAKESTSVTVSWNQDSNAVKYEYFLAEYPKGYAYTTNSGHGFTTDNFVKFDNLISGNYSVFIHGISADGERSEQSNWVSFDIYADDYIPTKTVVSNNHIYALYDYEMSWSFARDLCKELGGNLVTVTSAKENAVITDLIQSGTKDAYWLGATDIDGNDKDFKWVTDETFSYSNWMSGEPNSAGTYGEKEHFIEVRKSYGNKWNDVNNISKKNKGFILEVDLSKVSPTAEGNFKGNKYLLFDKNTTWTEAQEICEQYDGHLATIENTDESTFIKNFLKAGKRGWYYLGGQKSNNTWKWLDGTAINTVTWDDSAPNWDGTNLMMYKSDGSCVGLDNAYYPENDISKIGFVCEIEAGEETPMPNPTPTAAPTPKPTPIPACFSVNYGDGYVDITNTGDTMQTVSVIEANYSGKTFVDLKSSQMTFGAGEKRTVIIDNNTKIFVWDSLSGMKPLLK